MNQNLANDNRKSSIAGKTSWCPCFFIIVSVIIVAVIFLIIISRQPRQNSVSTPALNASEVPKRAIPDKATPVPTSTPNPTSTPTLTPTSTPTSTLTPTLPGKLYYVVFITDPVPIGRVHHVFVSLDGGTEINKGIASGPVNISFSATFSHSLRIWVDIDPGTTLTETLQLNPKMENIIITKKADENGILYLVPTLQPSP